jgi:hypothetical protein
VIPFTGGGIAPLMVGVGVGVAEGVGVGVD